MDRDVALIVAGTCLIAGTYGLVRLAYGLFLPGIQESVSMSSSVAGYVSSGASAAYCAGALVGLVTDRARALVLAALGTASLGSIGMAVAPGMSVLVPSAILASAGAGLASPALVAVVERNLPAERVDKAQATVNAGTGPGLVAAGLLALLLPEWRVGFAVSAVLTAAAGLGVLLLDRPVPTAAGRAPGRTSGSARRRAGSGGGGGRWVTALLRPAAAAFLLGAASATVWTYGRAHLVASGLSDSASVLAWIAIGIGGAATVLTARLLSAVPAPHAWLLTTTAAAAATAGLAAPGWLPVAIVACAVFGWGFIAASSVLIAWIARLVPHRTAPGTSVVFIALVLGQAAGSSATGALSATAGLPVTFLLAACATVAAASFGWGRDLRPAGPRTRRDLADA